jgi:hypothetical protein
MPMTEDDAVHCVQCGNSHKPSEDHVWDTQPDHKPLCIGCLKRPEDMEEYTTMAKEYECTPDQFVQREEGTYNPRNGHFTCTACYIKMGMPSSPFGWKAP